MVHAEVYDQWPESGVQVELIAEERQGLSALSAAASELVAHLGPQESSWSPWQDLPRFAPQCLPLVRDAAMVLDGADGPAVAAPGSAVVAGLLHAEAAQHCGPITDVLSGQDMVVSNRLGVDPRWGSFGEFAATSADIRSLLALRVTGCGDAAALVLCSPWPEAFDDSAVCRAELLRSLYCLAATALAGRTRSAQ